MSEYALAISDAEIHRYRWMAERAQVAETPLWWQAGIIPGAYVVDVGAGPAAVSVVLAGVVGPSGRVVAVERDEAALEAARRVVSGSGLGNISLQSGTATDTGIAARSADVVMCRNVLAHNGPHEQDIIEHLVEICRPGGVVYLVDVDGTGMRILDVDPELGDMNARYTEFHCRRGNDLLTGLRLAKLLEGAGLDVLAHEGRYNILAAPPGMRPPAWAAREAMLAEGIVTKDDLNRWEAALGRMDAAAVRPTIFAPQFVALGRKPG